MEFTQRESITIFGDSIPRGIVTDGERMMRLSCGVVKKVEDKYGISINNVSSYGQTLSKLCERGSIDAYLEKIDKTKKNIVVLSIGGNDADYDWAVVAKTPLEKHLNKTDLNDYAEKLDSVIKKLKSKDVHVVLMSLLPIFSERYFKNVLSKVASPQAILEFLDGDITNIYRQQEAFNVKVYEIANINKCLFFDIRSKFLMNKSLASMYCEDGIHPNEKGHEYLAEIICQLIDNYKSGDVV